ncbi:hypothetical protein LO762_18055 [Actinocorallia sp. API 0066]|uniref:hypothetical protein n=1 Tax=Actinocorallia sp. API 0066 TaxID=2896846 RepID=UPI001E428F9D|nr:hypothetical protein [Actinocorallia sp. API 0066]MCD0451087.1 hypothetical protein [Actinocorallia sp. API 0066]
MKRVIFAGGLAVGYVLGARAGRERYEQIRRAALDVWGHPAVQTAAASVREQAAEAGSKGAHRAGELARDGWARTGEMAGAARQKVNERLHRKEEREEEMAAT